VRRAGRVVLSALVGAVVLPASSGASNGTYDVVFCHELHRGFGGTIEATNSFFVRNRCSDPQYSSAIQIESVDRTSDGRSARAFWELADPLGITGVEVEGRLRRANGYRSELFMADAEGRKTQQVGVGESSSDGFQTYDWQGKPQQRFTASLECGQSSSCPASDTAKTWLRSLRLTVVDGADPEVEVGLELFEDRWVRGDASTFLSATDTGSGLFAAGIEVNGSSLVNLDPACESRIADRFASAIVPCASAVSTTSVLATSEAPFKNGVNSVRACSTDFAANESCLTRDVRVDNELPNLAFREPDPEDPELVRVPVRDQFSGLASGSISYRLMGSTDWQPLFTQSLAGELRARVDSAAETPGTYEFRAIATDVAGNQAETVLREDGSPMTLQFPLRSGVDLDAHIEPGGSQRTTVAYGKSAHVEGRLLDAVGQPLSGKSVVVDEDFGQGALIDHRVRTVVTDASGRWSSKLPAGPTRSVSAEYEGDQRYLDARVGAGRLSVRTGAKLGLTHTHVSEGRAITFKGRVERLGARIPAGGKLVQIQYQDPISGRWATVRNPFRTKSDGRFSFKYGFGTHYVQDVAIRFRLKVPSELGWPYRGTHTGARRVIVEARP
jgi:hypothetical protein